jgi:Protein tyrosine and serine/threonine kinase
MQAKNVCRIAGMPFYLAPEVKAAERTVCASDTFSFGVILWELFMGQPPCLETPSGHLSHHTSFPTFPDFCPFNYAVLALACMAPEPRERPPMYQVRNCILTLSAAAISSNSA